MPANMAYSTPEIASITVSTTMGYITPTTVSSSVESDSGKSAMMEIISMCFQKGLD